MCFRAEKLEILGWSRRLGGGLKCIILKSNSFLADYGCRCVMRKTRNMSVLKIGRMFWRGVGNVASEGKGKGTRDGDEVER